MVVVTTTRHHKVQCRQALSRGTIPNPFSGLTVMVCAYLLSSLHLILKQARYYDPLTTIPKMARRLLTTRLLSIHCGCASISVNR